jgi:hypothetical protein
MQLLLILLLLSGLRASDVAVGDVFEVVTPKRIPYATNALFVEELGKALKAHDNPGVKQMIARGTVDVLERGVTFRVLGRHRHDPFTPYGFFECRAMQGDKVLGKAYLYDGYMDEDTGFLRRVPGR